jgi:hypothetical protein
MKSEGLVDSTRKGSSKMTDPKEKLAGYRVAGAIGPMKE